MCVGAGDALSAGARSALADMRGPGGPPGLGGGRRAPLAVAVIFVCVCALYSRHQANLFMHALIMMITDSVDGKHNSVSSASMY